MEAPAERIRWKSRYRENIGASIAFDQHTYNAIDEYPRVAPPSILPQRQPHDILTCVGAVSVRVCVAPPPASRLSPPGVGVA
jgi:hypothetical protein